MTDTYKYQARIDPTWTCWYVEDRTGASYWTVWFSRLGEPHIENVRTEHSVNPYSPTGRAIVNAVRRALETDATN